MSPSIDVPYQQADAFPVLTPEQIARIRPHTNVRRVVLGEILFEPGTLGMPCFVVVSGKLEISMLGLSGDQVFATHGPGQFSGDVVLISGAGSLARGRVSEPGEFLELSTDALRNLIAKDSELSDIFMRAFLLRRVTLISKGLGNVTMLGSRCSSSTLRLREFLNRNGHPYNYVDLDNDRASQELLDRWNIKPKDIPVVICSGNNVLRNPTTRQLAECLGLTSHIEQDRIYDVAIVGAGPAGLAAAVYAASEGLEAVVIESEYPGGQAGASSKIENYIGFPMGISGQELASRAVLQAEKFGAQMMIGEKVVQVRCEQRPYQLVLENGGLIDARSIVIATGAQYNKPHVQNLQRFEGQGIYYAATFMEAQLCVGEEIIVVGGGNSAGQAAVFLAESARKVCMLVRGKKLSETMSRYLIQRIVENPGIELHFQTEIVGLAGESHLEQVTWQDTTSREESVHDIRHVFVMAGASPHTRWLRGCVALDIGETKPVKKTSECLIAEVPPSNSRVGMTIGIDLGDVWSHYCTLNEDGEVVDRGRFRTTPSGVEKWFTDLSRVRIAMEAGTHSIWISEQLRELGHEVIVANVRELRAISHSDRKSYQVDAEKLARYARLDPKILRPVSHRTVAQQEALTLIRARNLIVRLRTAAVNALRRLAKPCGDRLPPSSTLCFAQRCMAVLPPGLAEALGPVLEQIAAMTVKYDRAIQRLTETEYPETQALIHVYGVGQLTALTYVLTLRSKERFRRSRDVGCYLGLRPRRSQSGDSDPQLGITKAGNIYLRSLVVERANHVLGPHGRDSTLRRWSLHLASRGGKQSRNRAIVAVARKLAVLLHRIWVTQEPYIPFYAVAA